MEVCEKSFFSLLSLGGCLNCQVLNLEQKKIWRIALQVSSTELVSLRTDKPSIIMISSRNHYPASNEGKQPQVSADLSSRSNHNIPVNPTPSLSSNLLLIPHPVSLQP